ncbi:hypothetical protein OSB04_020969 [Centaurea solstitialis]|uniref:Uncharacterized protein n=1 Tax=Centaurea solstitialis TaxID=347529 RepID=A0AA38T4Q3_9ASTR|nr:hypothetical protein OSB04_020969 [Centaurea solstitialis]
MRQRVKLGRERSRGKILLLYVYEDLDYSWLYFTRVSYTYEMKTKSEKKMKYRSTEKIPKTPRYVSASNESTCQVQAAVDLSNPQTSYRRLLLQCLLWQYLIGKREENPASFASCNQPPISESSRNV